METKEQLLELIEANKSEIRRRFGVTRVGLFGSCCRGEACPNSDVDVLVEFEEPTFDHYMDLKFFLEGLFGRPVDLVMSDQLKPRLAPVIRREVVYA